MAKRGIFSGTAPALVTPFTTDDELDFPALRGLIDWQIEGGVEALVILGTTGENATIWPEERRRLVEVAIDHTAGRVPVIIGTGNNSTSESILFSREAAQAGADGLLVVGPYYNKPTQAGFRAHVAAIADATDCPIIVYNVPGRTSFNCKAETMLQIAEEVPSVVGVKEASGDLAQISDILAHRPDRLAVYSGDDEMTLPMIALGADGVVSVICNALPDVFDELVQAALAGEFEEARRMHFRLLPAMRACFVETNPIPVKAVLAAMGRVESTMRLPLIPISDENRNKVLQAFAEFTAVKA
ncbi:MAG TPA: 4-hydroxy-tetrahydrodipicolinate synthase [Rhodothermales bacterium]|nr:4-hydroxy-tetrahydrodipicolinate synthase [Rhodothermales bacterium]